MATLEYCIQASRRQVDFVLEHPDQSGLLLPGFHLAQDQEQYGEPGAGSYISLIGTTEYHGHNEPTQIDVRMSGALESIRYSIWRRLHRRGVGEYMTSLYISIGTDKPDTGFSDRP